MKKEIKHYINRDGSVNICLSLIIKREQIMKGHVKIELDLSNAANVSDPDATNIISCFSNYADAYNKKDKNVVKACAKKFIRFAEDFCINAHNLTPADCRTFRDCLYDNLNGNTPGNYFKKFRQFLDYLVEEEKITSNPAQRIKLTFTDFRPKDVITANEILLIKDYTHDEHDVLKAFLFSCYTGLRWCDIKELRRENIDLQQNSLTIVQRKVINKSKKAELHTFLNKTAMEIIADRCRMIDTNKNAMSNDLLFLLPSYSAMYKLLNQLTSKVGIHKHITFHCARHTFISNLVAKGVDIKTIAELAGHSSTRHTERYMHREDQHLRESIELLD